MAKKTLAEAELEMDALTLMDFLNTNLQDPNLVCVYVESDDGTMFTKVKLVESELTDGSKVHTIVLSE